MSDNQTACAGKGKGGKLIAGILIGYVFIFEYQILGSICDSLLEMQWAKVFSVFAVRVITYILCFLVIKKMYGERLSFSFANMKEGLFKYGLCMWILIVLNLVLEFKLPQARGWEVVSILLYSAVWALGVGIVEEVIFRGVFFNAFFKFFGDTKKGFILSLILSSAMFGLIHILNLINHPELLFATISQVVYAIFIGSLFCVIYYRTKNLWPGIILHALIDFSDDVFNALAKAERKDSSTFMAVFSVLVCLILFISALVQVNKIYKNKTISEAVSDEKVNLPQTD